MDPRRIEERLDVLAGERTGNARGRAAVRLDDLKPLLGQPPALKSVKAAGSAPTKAEFDALVDDVHALHRVLKATHDVLQARLLP